jgi:uncharacterized membrane protein YvbJ
LAYCTRCGALNPEDSLNCLNCGAPFVTEKAESRPYNRYDHSRYYTNTNGHRSSGIGLLIAGLIIILIGAAAMVGFTQFWTYFWPIVLILIGVWVIVLGLRRSRRYKQPLSR